MSHMNARRMFMLTIRIYKEISKETDERWLWIVYFMINTKNSNYSIKQYINIGMYELFIRITKSKNRNV